MPISKDSIGSHVLQNRLGRPGSGLSYSVLGNYFLVNLSLNCSWKVSYFRDLNT